MTDALAFHLLKHLIRRGDLDLDDIEAIATELEAEGESQAAHECRAAALEAQAPSNADWRRSKLHLIKTDGGKAND